MTRLTTDRLAMAPMGLEDFEDLIAVWSDPDFTRHITGRALTEEEVWLRLLRDVGHWNILGMGNWSLRTRDEGRYVGSVGILDYRRSVEPPMDSPELGWGLVPAFQGKGLAREGLSAALKWADSHLAASRTLCMISAENTASIRLADSVGYRPWVDTTYLGKQVTLYERPRL